MPKDDNPEPVIIEDTPEAIRLSWEKIERRSVDRHNQALRGKKIINIAVTVFMLTVYVLVSMAFFRAKMDLGAYAILIVGALFLLGHLKISLIPLLKTKNQEYSPEDTK